MLSGWGRYPCIAGHVLQPENQSEFFRILKDNDAGEILARGLGRSYGDAALSAGAKIVLCDKLKSILSFDSEAGILRCRPGMSFDDMLRIFLPLGWFPPVTPGTKHVTMGGALACDIHGKNHHKFGSFLNFVNSFKLVTASCEELNCSREENRELYFASAGGMGLTGVLSEIELRLLKVENPYMMVKKLRASGLQDTFRLIEENDPLYDYSVCWIDCLASGPQLGRSILILGRHAGAQEIALEEKQAAFRNAGAGLSVDFDLPGWILNRYSIGAFNHCYYYLSSCANEEKVQAYNGFFYPLDFISNWNRLYGKEGFIQYQCVLPLESSKVGLEEILALSAKRGRASFLAVLKKFGAGHGLLSFPISGYTLALDLPVKTGIFEFSRELDQIVLKHGGRVYLAKDACLEAESFRSMYKDYPEWLRIKKEVDPKNKFSSALSKRLRLNE